MGVCLTLPDWYFSVEFCQNFYIYLCRKGGAFHVSILVKIGWIFFILSSKNHENRSDLSSRPVESITTLWNVVVEGTKESHQSECPWFALHDEAFLKSAWRHSVYYYYDKARNTPYFASWHLGDSLGVYRWPQCRYKRRFYKSNSRLSKITTGNRCRNIRTMHNMTKRPLIDPNKSGTWG